MFDRESKESAKSRKVFAGYGVRVSGTRLLVGGRGRGLLSELGCADVSLRHYLPA